MSDLEKGAAFYNAGQYEDARVALTAVVSGGPKPAKALSFLGATLAALGDVQAGLDASEKALALMPELPLIHVLRAHVYLHGGRPEEAVAPFEQALRLNPADSTVAQSLAHLLVSLGRLGDALNAFDELEKLTPGAPGLTVMRAALHWQLGQLEPANALLETWLDQHPSDVEALTHLGLVRKAQGLLEEAIALFQAAARLDGRHREAHLNLAMTLQENGDASAAAAHLDRYVANDPSPALNMLNALILPVVLDTVDEADDWRARMALRLETVAQSGGSLDDPLNEVGLMQFHLAYQCRNDVALQRQIAQTYLKLCPSLGWIAPNLANPVAGARLKVGFVSANLRSHTVGWLNVGYIEQLNRDMFEIHVVAPPATPGGPDLLRRRIEAAADSVVCIPRDLAQARELIAAQHYDILYYPDIGMDAFTYYLAYARLAPVQAVAWGHPVTTGIPNMDYFVSCADMEPEDGAAAYSETLAQLPDVGAYLERPERPEGAFDRGAHGLPDDQPLLLCLQSCFKFHPEFDALLKRLLETIPEALLVLLQSHPRKPSDMLKARFEHTLGAAAKRVRFVGPLPQDDYLRLTADASVVLDIPQWSGGRSSYECLAMGALIAHLPGPFMRGRHTLAFYNVMGMTSCVAESDDGYVDLVSRLVREPEFNASVRHEIRESVPALFERKSAVAALEQFFVDAATP